MMPFIRSITTLALLALLAAAVSAAQTETGDVDLSGRWQGELSAARFQPIELILTVTAVDDNQYSATLDIPSQFQAGVQVTPFAPRNGNVTLRLPAIQAEFYGSLIHNAAGTEVVALEGDWNQSGEYIPLRLTPLAE